MQTNRAGIDITLKRVTKYYMPVISHYACDQPNWRAERVAVERR